MVLFEQMQSEPEPETIEIGEVHLVFDGDVKDPRTRGRVDQYLALFQDAVSSQSNGYSFYYGDRVVKISELFFELDEIVDGSVIAKAKLVGGFVLGTYGAIAAYPSFKEAIPMIAQDLNSAFEYVTEHAPEQNEDMPPPKNAQVYFRDEKEIEELLEQKLY
ncbi:hypothetical protein JQX09_20790 [Sulfitobacter pseudonitzschiae]|uniref:Uncharacterized protein n=2 Tax=Pseudosulfitobacter pseudonitzschiae TaxID=1402135 RepID=A0A9Q2NPC9_9RHOB|nr:hypothetical protein [Pseudosulfitobacter pseudonitzschiae]MBM2318892.1 hypothetical protein [Pseudosulfitobacter pseudonitzschiae]MBM2328476.1 hypothetical protein [Pseudosulfitobacter pseudonitzschiae]MBM2357003.1 hypothetical protein [Pseudosulfitobacter pseudonitzschiae]MBM2385777.1 hypothetical protein [Pseudosulfitobacter pseudonitzschiae]